MSYSTSFTDLFLFLLSLAGACVGRVGSAFAAELGTMAVSEQTDSLRMLGSDPTDYLVSPRVLACMIALPILNVMCFLMGGHTCEAPCSHEGQPAQAQAAGPLI